MLIEEIDRLQADVWMAGEAAVQRARVAAAAEREPAAERAEEPPGVEVDSAETIALSLSERIARGRAPSEPAG
jgi:hypothetical protein